MGPDFIDAFEDQIITVLLPKFVKLVAFYLWNVFRVLFDVLGSELCLITFNVIYCNIYTLLFEVLGSVRSFIQ